jgi:hypothetical protein
MKKMTIMILMSLTASLGFAQNATQTMAQTKKNLKKGDIYCSGTPDGVSVPPLVYAVRIQDQPNRYTISYSYPANAYWSAMGQCFARTTYVSAANEIVKIEGQDGKCSLSMNLSSFNRTGVLKYDSVFTFKGQTKMNSLSLTCEKVASF